MHVLVDTSVWSLALRRKQENALNKKVLQLKELIEESRVKIVGPIRQEILSGVSNPKQFQILREKLRAFDDVNLANHDYETAAEMFNTCRQNGIQGSHIDFLICAAAKNYNLSILTTDKDFNCYEKYLSINLF
jgi:predicted nucleic acid-binding protein